jgi:serralysin
MAAVRDVPGSGYGSAYIDSLVWGGKAWDPGKGPIKYLFGSRANFDAAGARHGISLYLSDRADIQAWTAGEMGTFKAALALYAKVCGLTFAPAGSAADADIVWWKTEIWTGSAGVHEIPDDEPVWGYFNPTDDWKNLHIGGDGRNTIMHEIGHGVGLAHPHDGGWEDDATRFPGVSSAHDTGRNGLNQGIWTVMSYNSGWSQRDHDATYGAQGALGALDIAALQAVYGPNPNTARGGNVYFLPTREGSGTGWSCIWDAGGVDTISALHSHQGVTIDLRPASLRDNDPHAGGYVSAQSDIAGGFTIANGVTIENALGGAGNDFIKGNGAANRLRGLAGGDTLHGYDGNDRLEGGAGRDTLTGGRGQDTFVFDMKLDRKTNVDRIADFRPDEDTIRLDDRIFRSLRPGILDEDAFHNGAKAADAEDRILYNGRTGLLSYDPDGSGARPPMQIAVLHAKLVLSHHDFMVF